MGANAQTSVPAFVTGQVLTAQQQTEINTGIPVFADSTARDAAFGGTGEKTLAEGQYAYLEDTNATQFYDGASWEPVGVAPGLVLIQSQTVGSGVSSVTVTSCFNASYDSYQIIASGVAASGSGEVGFQLTGLTTGYYGGLIVSSFTAGGPFLSGYNNLSSVTYGGGTDSSFFYMNMTVDNPFLAKPTFIVSNYIDNVNAGISTAKQTSSTSSTGFTITPSVGTLTGGTIQIFGLSNS